MHSAQGSRVRWLQSCAQLFPFEGDRVVEVCEVDGHGHPGKLARPDVPEETPAQQPMSQWSIRFRLLVCTYDAPGSTCRQANGMLIKELALHSVYFSAF